jgi:hypothetical protein
MQDSYKVEGPACKTRIVQGLLKEIATAAPWILDPTPQTCACAVDRSMHPAHGSTVHHTVGVSPGFDQRRGSAIQRLRTHASGGGDGVHQRAAARGGGSPASPLDSVPDHHMVHGLVHFVAEARVHVTGGIGGSSCLVSGRHRKGRRSRSGKLVSAPKCTR